MVQNFKWLVGLFVLLQCQSESSREELFMPGKVLGVNENPKLEETSGLAASILRPGMLWAHNDSGHPPEIFLLDSSGQTVASYRIEGIKNRDWEDIATGTWSDDTPAIFIADIGDNRRRHRHKHIYVIKEPETDSAGANLLQTLSFQYSDGRRDAETLLFDPVTRNLYMVTKVEHEVRIYELSYPYRPDTLELSPAARLPLRHITAGDISRDGSEILLKNYHAIYYWKRLPGQSIVDALAQDPIELPYKREPLGESIAWAGDSRGYYTLSENHKGERGRLIFYSRLQPVDSLSNQP